MSGRSGRGAGEKDEAWNLIAVSRVHLGAQLLASLARLALVLPPEVSVLLPQIPAGFLW